MKQNGFKSKCKISKVEVTKDTLTGRGGLALFVWYLSQIIVIQIIHAIIRPNLGVLIMAGIRKV